MDVYLKRNYEDTAVQPEKDGSEFPFWDYRSCRGKYTATPVPSTEDEGNQAHMSSSRESPGLSNGSDLDPSRVTLHIIADPHEICPLLDLYQPVIDCVDPTLKLFRVTERNDAINDNGPISTQNGCTEIPAISVMVFLRGSDPDGVQNGRTQDRLDEARHLFQRPPWRFHHNEKPNQGKINMVQNNSQEFYYTSTDLPLWGLRHVHYGREHIRYVLYSSDESWPDQVHFYKLILGIDPDLLRDDFCLFTVYKHDDYDVQLALKKVTPEAKILILDSVHIQVKVRDVGQLVPLFPNVCRPISDVKWQTTDHDGNIVVLDVVNPMNSPNDNRKSPTRSTQRSEQSFNFPSKHRHFDHHSDNLKRRTYNSSEDNENLSVSAFLRSDLHLHTINSHYHHHHHQTYNHDSEDSALFDPNSDDLDLDLPSPSLRGNSKKDEDVESLTLTNTSEESGIQMQNGSEDLSFCDDEPLRPILTKNKFKFRNRNLRVTFNDEVEAFSFQDDSFSRLSSGIDSEDQSDGEMETRFAYIPSDSKTVISDPTTSGKPSNGFSINGGRSTPMPPQFLHQYNDNTDIHNSENYPPSKNASCSSPLNPNSHKLQVSKNAENVHRNISVTQEQNRQSGEPRSLSQIGINCSPNEFENQAHHERDCVDNVMPVSQTRFNNKNGKDLIPDRPPLPPYPGHLQNKPPSYRNACGTPQPHDLQERQCSYEKQTLPNSFSYNIQPREPTPSPDSNKHLGDGHHQKRPFSNTNASKSESPPPLPPVRSAKTKLTSVNSNPQHKNSSHLFPKPSNIRPSFKPSPSSQQGLKKASLKTNSRSSVAQSDNNENNTSVGQDDTTLKFTLKFDTTIGKEQVGFYV